MSKKGKKDFTDVVNFDDLPSADQRSNPSVTALGVTSSPHYVDSLQISRPKIRTLDIDKIKPSPNQPRMTFEEDALRELGETIKAKGLLQEIGVIPIDDGYYELIYGERRLRACKYIGLTEIIARIFDPRADVDELTLIENIQREELRPEEEARSIRNLMKRKQYTQDKMSEVIRKSRSNIAKYVSIADFVDDVAVSDLVSQIRAAKVSLTMEILYMASAANPREQGMELLRNALNGKLTVKTAREMQKGRGTTALTGKQVIGKLAEIRNKFDFAFLKGTLHQVCTEMEIKPLMKEIDVTLTAMEAAIKDLNSIRQSLMEKT